MSKTKPTIFETVQEIIKSTDMPLTLDEIIAAFKEVNPKHDKYNYKANIRQAIEVKDSIIEVRLKDTYALARWLFDGRCFRVRPGQEGITEGLAAQNIPECIPLILNLNMKRHKKSVPIFDSHTKNYYELSLAWSGDFLKPLHLKGLERWYLDVGFRPGDEIILSCVDFDAGQFQIEHCRADVRDEKAIKEANEVVAEAVHELLVRGDTIQPYGEKYGYSLTDLFYFILAASRDGGYEGDKGHERMYTWPTPPDGIIDILLEDSRLIVKERYFAFLKEDYERLYPYDDFDSGRAALARELSEDQALNWLTEDEDSEDTWWGYDGLSDGELEEDELDELMLDLAANIALAKTPAIIIEELLEDDGLYDVGFGDDPESVTDLVKEFWNEVPRPELGFRSPNEVAKATGGAMTTGGRHSRTISVDFENRKKVGRNDSCPCGSGKKYKKCCLTKQEETEYLAREGEKHSEKFGEKYGEDNEDIEKIMFNMAVAERTIELMDEDELDAIELSACHPYCQVLVAHQYRVLGKVDEAVAILMPFAEAGEVEPGFGYSIVYLELALCHAMRESWAEALYWIEQAIECAAEHEDGEGQSRFKLLQAGFYASLGDEEKALKIFEELKAKGFAGLGLDDPDLGNLDLDDLDYGSLGFDDQDGGRTWTYLPTCLLRRVGRWKKVYRELAAPRRARRLSALKRLCMRPGKLRESSASSWPRKPLKYRKLAPMRMCS